MDYTEKLTHISLCTGYGGIDLGLERALGVVRTICYVEIEAFVIENVVAKIQAGLLDPAPIYSNLKTFPWRQFNGRVDILSGGFPCQPFSVAGQKAGDEDPRHLFPYIMQGIRELGRPPIVLFENVEGIISSKLKGDEWADPEGTSVLLHVLRELERVGYEAEAGVFSAREIGAPHQRKRVFIMGVRSDLSDTGRDTVSAMLRATERGGWKPTKVSAVGNAKHNGHPTSKIRRGDGAPFNNRGASGEGDVREPKRASDPLQVLSTERGDVGNAPRWDAQCSCGRGRSEQRGAQIQDRESGAERGQNVAHTCSNSEHSQRAPLYSAGRAVGRTGEGVQGEWYAQNLNSKYASRSTAYPAPRGAEQYEWEPPRVTSLENALCGKQRPYGWIAGFLSGAACEGAADRSTWADSLERQRVQGQVEPAMGGGTDGAPDWLDYAELCHSVDNRTDELRMLGNGVVPETAERAFKELWGLV